jgi:hypothetical protein
MRSTASVTLTEFTGTNIPSTLMRDKVKEMFVAVLEVNIHVKWLLLYIYFYQIEITRGFILT